MSISLPLTSNSAQSFVNLNQEANFPKQKTYSHTEIFIDLFCMGWPVVGAMVGGTMLTIGILKVIGIAGLITVSVTTPPAALLVVASLLLSVSIFLACKFTKTFVEHFWGH